eukprot:TRINITY_DN75083_c0_g1_i1.p2 TRINITY_DN75083_c0_g1~~TRINITY_DN75083_c0_g1_i1.p2  ORF type:complete len:118 (+),score=33.75 TRINITY_DN75083_c0_g1_i1:56-409(+)
MAVAMKAMKGKKRGAGSKIARGKLAKALVLRGSKEKTSGGLRKDELMRNARGKVVSKKSSAVHRKLYVGSKFENWVGAVRKARKALSVSGFVAVNGRTPQGKALYAKAKSIYTAGSA